MAIGPPYTYRDPTLSLWQAAVAALGRQYESVQRRMAPSTRRRLKLKVPPALKNLMAPAHALGAWLNEGQNPTPEMFAQLAAVPIDCVKIAAEFLWAEIIDDRERAAVLAGELRYSVCDLGGWSECLITYYAYKASSQTPLYRADHNVIVDLDRKTRIALVGDWGTGQNVAINLLQQVARFQPDVLIHLGDVYYADTQAEERGNVIDLCQQILGHGVPIFSLCGNHDMYSGGRGYYWLLDYLGQPASYFSLRNSVWQFLAMDTGHNDRNPLTATTNMTSLVNTPSWSEAQWHLEKIEAAGARRTVLLSHHQLFSPFGAVGSIAGKKYAFDPYLLSDFQGVLGKIAWWFWGHEHTLAAYDPYLGLARGRCLGASAVPVFIDQQTYQTAKGLKTYQGALPPNWNGSCVLGNNGTAYDHAFGIMTLKGSAASVRYYRVPVLQTAKALPFVDAV